MRVTCERCLRRYDVPDATVKGRKIRARCKCGARVVVQDEERAAKSLAAGSQTTGSIQRPVRWFVDITSWEPIAMDMRQLVRAFDAGRIDADTLVWRKGMPDWRRLRDISELAERLVGAGGDASEKSASEPPPADLSQSTSEPPPRQSERSRTPPASYTVSGRSGSEPPVAGEGAAPLGAVAQGADRRSSVPPGLSPSMASAGGSSSVSLGSPSFSSTSTSTASIGMVPPPSAHERASAADDSSNAPPSRRSTPSGSPRAPSRRGRSKTPSRPNASLAPVPSRTVTQTGLESPAEVTARSSIAPGAGAASGEAVATRTRDSRTSVAPAGGRRQPSSDETPAQKPSSLSVPPGAIVEGRSRARGRRILAIAALVLGGAFILRQFASGGDGAKVTADHRVDAVHAPQQVAPERKAAAGQPLPSAPAPDSSSPSTAHAAAEPHAAGPAVAAGATKSAAGTPTPAGSALLPAAPSATPLNVEASAKETVGAVPPVADAPKLPELRAPIAAPAASKPESPAPAARPLPAPVAALPPPVAKPQPPAAISKPPAAIAPPPAAPAAAAPAPVAREPRPFDETLATQQFQAAVAKANSCGQQGTTRGTGRVKVAIEPWGRVGRVTHLNQEFVGTPVGLCIMQAFQEIRVPPFDGNSRSIAGEFVVE